MRISGLLKVGLVTTGIVLVIVADRIQADGWNSISPGNRLTNQASGVQQLGGIANTRHNLTMAYMGNAADRAKMDQARNNYFEVCVYCHTPHGANSQVGAPLWNRTVSTRTYQLFSDRVDMPDQANASTTPVATLTGQPYTQPGPNSLTCLSCHDGATAIDSIINMPTQLTAEGRRAGWNPDAEILEDIMLNSDNTIAWDKNLDDWAGNALGTASPTDHRGLNSGGSFECLSCHNGTGGAPAPDFDVFVIGADFDGNPNTTSIGNDDLRDDHPIGVRFPMGSAAQAYDYNEPDMKKGRIAFWDDNRNGHADPNEVRLYDTGDGYEVECASCHDPHGVPVQGQTSATAMASLTPSFLRVGAMTNTSGGGFTASHAGSDDIAIANPGSQLCLTCHVK